MSTLRTLRPFGALSVLMLLWAATPLARAEETTATAAPQFALKDLDGKTVRLSDLKGHPVVLDFWATWCQPCRASMPHLSMLQDHYRQQGLVVLGVSVDDGGPQRVKRFTDHMGVHYRVAMADEHMLDEYGPIRSIPTMFFIDRQGLVARRVVGYVDQETLDSFAEEVVAK